MIALHELVTALAAPWVVLSPRSGQLTGSGAEGVYARDRRILSRLRVTIDGREPSPVHVVERGAASHQYVAMVEGLGDTRHDPTVMVYRTREVDSEGLTERITLVNRSRATIECRLDVALGTDLAGTAAVRSGAAAELPDLTPPTRLGDPGRLHWESAGTRVNVSAEPGLAVTPRLEPGEEFTVTLRVTADFPESTTGFSFEPPADRAPYTLGLTCDDTRVERWVNRSLEDVLALQLAVGIDRYLGAGP
ncbi:MAG TPA: glycogen debranching N-terminal domain-containing protein, partial [Kribbella sp.]|nr:glycogen debranching N-terminal domain-containing protein [Kribbella sp.]